MGYYLMVGKNWTFWKLITSQMEYWLGVIDEIKEKRMIFLKVFGNFLGDNITPVTFQGVGEICS